MSTGQERLNKAITDKLRADSGAADRLVELTGYSATKLRIGRDKPVTKGEAPFLGVSVFNSEPIAEDGPTHVQRARVHFRAYSTSELTAIKLGDRLEVLLHAVATQNSGRTNAEWFNFSNAQVSNKQTRFKNRDQANFDDETDVWSVLVEADVVWLDEPCP